MQGTQLETCKAAMGSTGKRSTELRVYLERIVDQLDDSTFRATLKLMIAEVRDAIGKQRGLIALERLDGRNTTGRMDQLQELKSLRDQLEAVLTNQVEAGDDFSAAKSEPLGGLRPLRTNDTLEAAICTATIPLPRSFRSPALANAEQQEEVYVGVGPAAEFPAKSTPAICNRQCRNGSAPAR